VSQLILKLLSVTAEPAGFICVVGMATVFPQAGFLGKSEYSPDFAGF